MTHYSPNTEKHIRWPTVQIFPTGFLCKMLQPYNWAGLSPSNHRDGSETEVCILSNHLIHTLLNDTLYDEKDSKPECQPYSKTSTACPRSGGGDLSDFSYSFQNSTKALFFSCPIFLYGYLLC